MPYTPTWNNPYLPQVTVPQGYGVTQQLPMGYQPQPMPVQQPVNGIIKVNGRDSALQYQLPPNSMSQALFDQNGRVFYIVSTDGAGTKTVEAFDFFPHVEEVPRPVQIDGARFDSQQDFDDFAAKVKAVIGVTGNELHAAVPAAAEPAVPAAAPVAAHARPAAD